MPPRDLQPDDEERLEKLPGDPNTPGAPADDVNALRLPADDPRKDSDVDPDEAYDAGVNTAAAPNFDSPEPVADYHEPEGGVDDETPEE